MYLIQFLVPGQKNLEPFWKFPLSSVMITVAQVGLEILSSSNLPVSASRVSATTNTLLIYLFLLVLHILGKCSTTNSIHNFPGSFTVSLEMSSRLSLWGSSDYRHIPPHLVQPSLISAPLIWGSATFFSLFSFETRSCYIAQAGLKIVILLAQLPQDQGFSG